MLTVVHHLAQLAASHPGPQHFEADPLLRDHGLTWITWVILIVKALVVLGVVLFAVLMMVMYERKAVAFLGNRPGPNRAGPWGMLQSLADGTKLFFKEAFTPARSDKIVYKLAPYLSLVPALVAFAVIPFGGTITPVHGYTTALQLADPQWGILVLLITSGLGVYGIMLAGWASGSKYPLLGSVRATAQMISYESAIGLTVATVVMTAGSLSTSAIVQEQRKGFLLGWNFLHPAPLGLIPFAVFVVAITAEMTRPPFDLVEAEEEISGGYNMEYGSVGFALFYLAEYAALVTNSAFIATLWLGGPDGPRIAGHSIGPFWLFLKVFIILYIYVWVRATLPRFRYDQLMDLGWKRLIPISLAALMVIAGFEIGRYDGLGAAAAAVAGWALLKRAITVGRATRERELESGEEAYG